MNKGNKLRVGTPPVMRVLHEGSSNIPVTGSIKKWPLGTYVTKSAIGRDKDGNPIYVHNRRERRYLKKTLRYGVHHSLSPFIARIQFLVCKNTGDLKYIVHFKKH